MAAREKECGAVPEEFLEENDELNEYYEQRYNEFINDKDLEVVILFNDQVF